MTGIYLAFGNSSTLAVATDGHRLVRVTSAAVAPGFERTVIVPAKALALVLRLFPTEALTIGLSDTHVRFTGAGLTIDARLIQESYPNYDGVIPKDNATFLTIERRGLLESVRRVGMFSNYATRQVKLALGAEGVGVSAEDIDSSGSAAEQVAGALTGDGFEIGFNGRYVEDALAHLDGDTVRFSFSSPTRACLVEPAAPADGVEVLMLVMPVRINA
jgi:DNA polymerase-3 subunit beta